MNLQNRLVKLENIALKLKPEAGGKPMYIEIFRDGKYVPNSLVDEKTALSAFQVLEQQGVKVDGYHGARWPENIVQK